MGFQHAHHMWLSIFEPRGSGWGEVYMLHASNCLTSFLVRRATFREIDHFLLSRGGPAVHMEEVRSAVARSSGTWPSIPIPPVGGHKLEGFYTTAAGIFGSNVPS